jgi:hypothetical protein
VYSPGAPHGAVVAMVRSTDVRGMADCMPIRSLHAIDA